MKYYISYISDPLQTLTQAVQNLLHEFIYWRLMRTGYTPLNWYDKRQIAPTEDDKIFRKQTVRGYVHDPGAAMYGGVAGHAGLFSNAVDLAQIMQMLLNGGTYNGKRFLSANTIALFTKQHSAVSRRGLGFDKPDSDPNKKPNMWEGAHP